jgi:hypothetical protein
MSKDQWIGMELMNRVIGPNRRDHVVDTHEDDV